MVRRRLPSASSASDACGMHPSGGGYPTPNHVRRRVSARACPQMSWRIDSHRPVIHRPLRRPPRERRGFREPGAVRLQGSRATVVGHLRCNTDIYDLRLATSLARETDPPRGRRSDRGRTLALGRYIPGSKGSSVRAQREYQNPQTGAAQKTGLPFKGVRTTDLPLTPNTSGVEHRRSCRTPLLKHQTSAYYLKGFVGSDGCS